LVLALVAVAASAASAAPVIGSDEGASLETSLEALPQSANRRAAPASTLRTLDRSLNPENSTGNKNLDLLLDLKVGPGEEARPAAPRRSAAAASAAAAELAVLRAKAAHRPTTLQDEQAVGEATTRPGLALQPFEALGTLQGDARAGPSDPALRREWSGQFGGGGMAGAGGGPGGASKAGHDDDNPLRRILSEVRQFVREHGLSLFGAVAAVAVLGAALKAYSRRP
jgi:hypothetical protein